MKPSNKQRMLEKLRQAGTTGLHSHDLRTSGTTGSPSMRAKDLRTDGWNIYKRPEHRGKSPGVRFWIAPYQPANAELVTPNPQPGVELGGSQGPSSDGAAVTELDAGSDVAVGGGTAPATVGSRTPARSGPGAAPDPDADGGRLFSLPSPEPRGVADREEDAA